jgi:alkylated DNA repair dioxygenase AlkB
MAIVHDNSTVIKQFGDGIAGQYHPNFLSEELCNNLRQHLDSLPFSQVSYKKFGQIRNTPRLTYCYGQLNDEPVARYRGVSFKTEPIPVWLQDVLSHIQKSTGYTYNAVILNKYVDGNRYINWHQDDESFLGHKVVASISIGQSRDFQFKATENSPVHQITLLDRSLFLIDEGLWHCLPKRARITGVRYNITFRNVNSSLGIGNYYYYNRGLSFALPNPVQQPVQQSVQQPVQQSIQHSTQQPVQQSIQHSTQQPVQQSIQQSIQQPVQRLALKEFMSPRRKLLLGIK